jgi:phytanoyl-CoA hydroxylase
VTVQLSAAQVEQYRQTGYLVVPGVFTADEIPGMIEHYMTMRAEGPKPGDSGGTPYRPDDPNHQYPRLINMHDWDETTGAWAQRDDLLSAIGELFDDGALLRQTMLYFKPPGGRGQGLHQDEQYICQDPLLGLWVALDRADADVGQMVVVPGSHTGGLLPVEPADTAESFTPGQTVLPEGAEIVGIDLAPGDALFFDGRLIHGSFPNRTTDRWRRSFICHYVGEHAETFEPAPGTHMSHLPKAN